MNDTVVGFDIGGSAIKTGRVEPGRGRLLHEPEIIPLPQPASPEALLGAIDQHLEKLGWDGPFGVGYPGVVKNGRVGSAAHVDDRFIGLNWLTQLRTLTNHPVTLINDADAAGLAEMRFGAGRTYKTSDSETVLLLTLGTGIGSALFHSGKLLPNTEFGHLKMNNSEAENLAAGVVKVRAGLSWEEYGERLSQFLREMNRLVSPDLIIIGGGISEDFDQFSPYLDGMTKVVPAQFCNWAGLIGAALAVADSL